MSNGNENKFVKSVVLIVQDQNSNINEMNTQLTLTGLRPVFISDSNKAISILKLAKERGVPIPVVILNDAVENMDGLALVQRVRAEQSVKDTNFIVLKPHQHEDRVIRYAALDVHQILQQPFLFNDLVSAIAEFVPTQTKQKEPIPTQYTNKRQVRILAADDDPVNLVVLKGFLNMSGYNLDMVKNGIEAVKAVRDTDYDLILMDICMPLMDGIFATIQIREIEKQLKKPPVPIVAVTGFLSDSQKARYKEVGMNGVLAKPLMKHVIDECLLKWCPRFSNSIADKNPPKQPKPESITSALGLQSPQLKDPAPIDEALNQQKTA